MNQHDESDPIANLQDWGRKTERRVRWGRRLKWLRHLVIVAVAVGLVAAAVPLIRSALPDSPATPAATAAAAGPGVTASSGPDEATVTTTGSAAPAGPFDGTAAARYPIGEAGITLPPAKAVTGFSKLEVAEALTRVRTALVLGRLDHDMIVGHRNAGFLRLFAPSERTSLGKSFKAGSFTGYATWIDPAVKLDPKNEPRVSGRVTYRSVVDDGIRTLRVTTNFVWIYAFQGEFAYRPLALHHDQVDWDFPQEKNLRPEDRGMWIGAVKSYGAWVDCAAAKKGLLAPTPKGVGGLPDPEDPDQLAKPDHTLEVKDGCA
jgi:hypothetical protein